MRKIEVVPNPVFLSIPVRYRNAKGRYTKPHLARFIEFKPPRARKVVRIELPKGRHKKSFVEEYAKKAVYAEVARRESGVIKREERERQRLPEAPRGEVPERKLKHKRRVQELYSKTLETEIYMVGHNFTFTKKIPVFPANYDTVAEYVHGMITELAQEILTKEDGWGNRVYIKIFGDGLYKRSSKRGKVVADRLGFSINRAKIRTKEHLEDHLYELFSLMKNRFFGSAGRGGYFSKKVNSNEYFFTGFRIEYVIEKG